MDLDPRTKARILKLFEHKICSSCDRQAERYLRGKLFCQKCFQEKTPFAPRVFVDPFPLLTEEEEMH